MNLEEEAKNEFEDEYIQEENPKPDGIETDSEIQQPGLRITDALPDLSFLMARTGEGPVENYVDHPMNRNKSHGVAQILRGITGMLGEFDYAIVDIALGIVDVIQERKVVPRNDEKATADGAQ